MKKSFSLTSHFFITSDGVKLRYLITPESKLSKSLVFVHGAGGDASAWKQEQKISHDAGYRSIAIDLRGHGLSDDPPDDKDYAFERLALDIAELVEKLKLRHVVVIGHCFGGMVSIVLASERHTFMEGLVLVDTSYRPSIFGFTDSIRPRLARTLRRLAYAFPPGSQEVRPTYDSYVNTADIDLRRLISDVAYTSLRSYLFCYGEMCEFDATALLEKIAVPTMVICGKEDTIFPLAVSRNLANRIKGASLTVVPGANHIIVISKPVLLAESIIKFIEKISNEH